MSASKADEGIYLYHIQTGRQAYIAADYFRAMTHYTQAHHAAERLFFDKDYTSSALEVPDAYVEATRTLAHLFGLTQDEQGQEDYLLQVHDGLIDAIIDYGRPSDFRQRCLSLLPLTLELLLAQWDSPRLLIKQAELRQQVYNLQRYFGDGTNQKEDLALETSQGHNRIA